MVSVKVAGVAPVQGFVCSSSMIPHNLVDEAPRLEIQTPEADDFKRTLEAKAMPEM